MHIFTDRGYIPLQVKTNHTMPLSSRGSNFFEIAHDPTLLEILGIGEESTAEQYCTAITDYKVGKIDYGTLVSIMGARHVLLKNIRRY